MGKIIITKNKAVAIGAGLVAITAFVTYHLTKEKTSNFSWSKLFSFSDWFGGGDWLTDGKLKGGYGAKQLNNILFVGDSITAGVNASYSYLIKNKLAGKKTVDILAVKGMTTSWMLDNLPAQLAKKKYDRVYIWGGVNDAFQDFAKSKSIDNVQAMVNLVNKQGGDAYVITGYDAEEFMDVNRFVPNTYVTTQDYLDTKERYAAYQKALKRDIEDAIVVPAFSIPSYQTADGIHPNGIAHINIANKLMKNIA